MPAPKIGKTGNAPIVKQGQTTDGLYGSDPDRKRRPAATPRDLKGK